MKTLPLLLLAALTPLAPLHAQSCGSGQTTTTFAAGNGNFAVMFDIAPSVDMTIECVDLNMFNAGSILDVEIYYCPTTCVGNETNPAAWTQIAVVPGVVGAAPGAPTPVDISGNGVVFAAGQTYGIYVQNQQSVIMAYSNGGPNNYFGDHCDVTTYYGSAVNWGGAIFYRTFNGTLRTEPVGPAGPALSVGAGAPGGSMTFDFAGFTASGQVAVVYGPAGVFPVNSGTCAGLVLDLLPLNFPPVTSLILVNADANGDAQLIQNVPGAAVGLSVQAVDRTTCGASNTIVL